MIKIEYINDLNMVSDILTGQPFDERTQRYRSSYLYRGLSNEDYKLETSLKRNCKHLQYDLELSVLRNFSKYAVLEDNSLYSSIWKQMMVGQHHSLPTRLLDWTYSPLMAFHFSVSENDLSNLDKHNSVIWRIDINEINSLLPQKYQDKLKEENAYLFTVDMLDEVSKSISEYDNSMNGKATVLIEPPSIDPRIINQYSYFSIIPKNMENIEEFLEQNTNDTVKYIISKDLRWQIRDMLDQMNINERIVYPGLDGLSQWLKRHYYVSDRINK